MEGTPIRFALLSFLLSPALACADAESMDSGGDTAGSGADGADGTGGTGGTGTDTGGTSAEPPPPPAYDVWLKVEPEGAICSDGSQYKFFVNYSETSDAVAVFLEPGGACWDYESCSGRHDLGAANPNGIPDNHMTTWALHSPLIRRYEEDNPIGDFNMVFLPYCTGDIHSGNAVVEYRDPEGVGEPITYHHNGHNNVMAVIDWMQVHFPQIPRLLVTGCSAGGVGSQVNYYFFRDRLDVDQGYMLNDSGPIFPDSTFSAPLHEEIRDIWNVDSVLESDPTFAPALEDFGNINSLAAEEFPDDRLSIAYFRRDFNYSRYSYERFYDPKPGKEEILDMWWADTQLLMDQYDEHDNLAYYIPFWRDLNDSHCTIIYEYEGTEIQEEDVDLHDFVQMLLDDDAPLESYLESVQSGEDGVE